MPSFFWQFYCIASSCKKLSRPALGDFPKDAEPTFPLYPGGPLKFFASFDGTTTNPLMNAVDSIRADFPTDNPLVTIDGVNGKGIQGMVKKQLNTHLAMISIQLQAVQFQCG